MAQRPPKKPRHKPLRPEATLKEKLKHRADELLARAGFQEESDLRNDTILRTLYMVSICPTDADKDDSGQVRDISVTVRDETPEVDASVTPESLTPAPLGPTQERIFWYGPNGKPCVLVEGERIREWSFRKMIEYEPASRAREWVFRGTPEKINEVKRRLFLTSLLFQRWLREKRPGSSERSVDKEGRIALFYIAESSSDLVHQGRYVPPYKKNQKDWPVVRNRPALSTTADAFGVTPGEVRRIRRDLALFSRSNLYQKKAALFDLVGGDVTRL